MKMIPDSGAISSRPCGCWTLCAGRSVAARTACWSTPGACAAPPAVVRIRPRAGVVTVLQPCSIDRGPDGPAHWLGPIDDTADIAIVQDWVERGEWERET